jgi:hypothetical protein
MSAKGKRESIKRRGGREKYKSEGRRLRVKVEYKVEGEGRNKESKRRTKGMKWKSNFSTILQYNWEPSNHR